MGRKVGLNLDGRRTIGVARGSHAEWLGVRAGWEIISINNCRQPNDRTWIISTFKSLAKQETIRVRFDCRPKEIENESTTFLEEDSGNYAKIQLTNNVNARETCIYLRSNKKSLNNNNFNKNNSDLKK